MLKASLVVRVGKGCVNLFGLQGRHLLGTLEVGAEERVRLLLRGLVAAGGAAKPLQLGRNLLPRVPDHLGEVTRVGLFVLHALGVRTEEADGEAPLAGSASSTYSVDVVLNGQREGVIDHQLHVLNVQAAARHVRGNERRLLGGLEVGDRLCPLVLRHVTLQSNDLIIALLPQESLEPRCLLLVETEHDDLLARGVVLLEVV
mmetsp:Transcript_38741/g.121056  ORF Transcript_38741/g.121056 Transcript_38741/m.121056 type:complete len:202 (+) Transcript_38741:115-720(+)